MQTQKAERHQRSEELSEWLQRRFQRLFRPNIRNKIILPYLVLTLIVAVLGIYVVTRLVVSSIDDLLTNALLEAGRVVSDDIALREIEHLEVARAIAFTTGLNEALQDGDRDAVVGMARPLAVLHDMECVIVTDARGEAVLHTLKQDGSTSDVVGQFGTAGLWMVRTLLDANDPNAPPKRGLVVHAVNERYYYFTALPIGLEGQVVGVVIIGTSLDTMLVRFKNTSLADVIIYLDGGRAVATTFALPEQPDAIQAFLDELSTTPAAYEGALYDQESTPLERLEVRDREYRLARNPLRVGNDTLGVFAVALPLNYVVESQLGSRNTYTLIFVVGMAGVIFIGYLISQRITNPLSRLVRTSQAVAEGNLAQRTGIVSADEIGMLAGTFDEMTVRLEERTHALEEAVGRMRAILSSMGDGVILEDLKGNQVPLNATAENLLEEMASDFMSGPLRDLPTPEDHDPSIMGDQPGLWQLEHRRFEVGQRVISAHSAEVRTDDDERLGTVIVMRDVTSEVEAERLKDEFITHVSHELRTPLTAIKGYGELLLSGAGGTLQDAQQSFLETINRNVDDLIAMVNELLDFSEMQASGRLGVVKRPTRLSSLVEEVVEEWRPRMDEKGLTFQVEISDGLPPIDADTRRLRWAVIHLVRNALQYTPSGGSVTVRLFEHDDHLVLDVTDTGIGISAKDLDNLFDRFYRVTNMPADEVRGLGVGLYLSDAIVEAHGGDINVVSEEGVGSTFSMVFPALHDVPDDEIDEA